MKNKEAEKVINMAEVNGNDVKKELNTNHEEQKDVKNEVAVKPTEKKEGLVKKLLKNGTVRTIVKVSIAALAGYGLTTVVDAVTGARSVNIDVSGLKEGQYCKLTLENGNVVANVVDTVVETVAEN